MNLLFKRTMTCAIFACFYFSAIMPVAHADEKVATVESGEVVPFSGTLFNTEAAARLLADLEMSSALCTIECDKKLEESSAKMQLEIDIMKASRDALQMRYDETLVLKNSEIDFLEKQMTKPKISRETVFIIGVVSGIALTVGSAYAIGQVAPN